ncbi:MAG: hypothetical protein L0323_23840 [Planctomycetes bacterium]|nr:hypothetical protein [Planctomycetota bacterium]
MRANATPPSGSGRDPRRGRGLRALLVLAVAVAAPILAVMIAVNVRAVRTDLARLTDPDLPISLPDGEVVPLRELVERSATAPAPEDSSRVVRTRVDLPNRTSTRPRFEGNPDALRAGESGGRRRERAQAGDLFALAEIQREEGRTDEALALYLSVPRSHPNYALARRRAGWHILADERGQPERGVPLVQEALLADPFSGNSWQDLARVYGRALGVPVR